MKKRTKRIIILVLLISIFSLSVISENKTKDNTKQTNAQTLSNQKIGWGIKRNDNHEQPDLGKKNLELLTQGEGIALGNKDKKYVYLTFDEGYEAGYTEKILATLKENQVNATFFITAHYLNTQPDLVKQMIEEGNIVGNQFPISLM